MDSFDHILIPEATTRSLRIHFPAGDGTCTTQEQPLSRLGSNTSRVCRVEDMPHPSRAPSASSPTQLNDHASDAERQRLLPFVTRLACADTPAVEAERAAYISSKRVTAYSFEYGSEGARRCPGNRTAGRHAWRR